MFVKFRVDCAKVPETTNMAQRALNPLIKMVMMMIRMEMMGKVVLSHKLSGHELRLFVLQHRVKKSVLLETRTEFRMGSLRGK